MRFDLSDLRLFLDVHEAGTITGGALRSHLTLASASERIRHMEDRLGGPLLLRSRRGVQPTAAGLTLLHHARLVLRQMAQLHDELHEHAQGLGGHVRVQCNSSAAAVHLPPLLGSFLSRHPGVAVDLEERSSEQIVDAVRHGLCDFGVVSDVVDLEGLTTCLLTPDPLALIVPRAHPWAARTTVRLADVANEPFVGLGEGRALQAHVTRQARRLGVSLRYRARVAGLDAVCRLVGEGVGVGIVPMAAAKASARRYGLRCIALAEAWAQRQLLLCMRPEGLTAPARELVDHCLGGLGRARSGPAAREAP